MNWGKLRSPARATFKNSNLRSLCELGKTWKYSLRPIFQNPNFASIDELGTFIKAGYISDISTKKWFSSKLFDGLLKKVWLYVSSISTTTLSENIAALWQVLRGGS